MGIPRFFKTISPNRFNYNPLYYDPDKEAREERIRRIKAEMGQDVSLGKKSSTITRGSFRQYSSSQKRKAGRESNMRLILIVAILLFLAYFLLFR